MRKAIAIAVSLSALVVGQLGEAWSETSQDVVHIPATLDKSCRNGRAQRYDECSHQIDLLLQAMKRARYENKVVLIVYGAEWCIWCHVFSKFVDGAAGDFEYTFGTIKDPDAGHTATLSETEQATTAADAAALKAFVAEHFIVTHIEGLYAPGGDVVLSSTRGDLAIGEGIPFVYTIKRSGRFAAKLNDNSVEVRSDWIISWYRGYDRRRLQAELKRMYEIANSE